MILRSPQEDLSSVVLPPWEIGPCHYTNWEIIFTETAFLFKFSTKKAEL